MSDKIHVLLVEDDKGSRRTMDRALRDHGFNVTAVANAREAFKALDENGISVIVVDYRLPDKDGIEFIREVRSKRSGLPCILITAYGDVESAVSAMQAGAFHFLMKPVEPENLVHIIQKACEHERLAIEVERLRRQLDEKYGFENIIGVSEPMRRVFEIIKLAAPTDSTILITGESGTGKELVARAIHQNSARRNEPFVPINCAALPEGLVESELFGHERGAFTGAVTSRKGYFEVAERGTLFIDEIGDMPLHLQPKLLRALEQRVITRVGSTTEIPVDVRIVAATNQDLEQAVQEKRFREDLMYRLSVVRIDLPPLRERQEDIPLLIALFMREFTIQHDRRVRDITPQALDILQRYSWPGNVRELRNTIESMIVLSTKEILTIEDIPRYILQRMGVMPLQRVIPALPPASQKTPQIRPLAEVEKEAILNALKACGGNKTRAAQMLGIGVRTIQRKLAQYRAAGEDV